MSATWTCICGKTFHAGAPPGELVNCPACGFVLGEALPDKFESATTIQAEAPAPRTVLADPEVLVQTAEPRRRVGGFDLEGAAEISIVKKGRHRHVFLLSLTVAFVAIFCGGVFLVVLPDFRTGFSLKEVVPAQLKSLTVACDAYRLKNDKFPKKLKSLTDKDQFGRRFVEDPESLRDPWGKPFQYDPKGPKNNGRHADIWTTAPDGTVIGNWPRVKN
jgi:hypothetical protein